MGRGWGWRPAAWLGVAVLLGALGPARPADAVPAAQMAGVATVQIEEPADGAALRGPATVRGWAADLNAAADTGVDQIVLTLGGPLNQGRRLGEATLGLSRPDLVAALNNPNLANAGFSFDWDTSTVPAGPQSLYVNAHSPLGVWAYVSANYTIQAVAPPAATPTTAAPPPPPAPTATVSVTATAAVTATATTPVTATATPVVTVTATTAPAAPAPGVPGAGLPTPANVTATFVGSKTVRVSWDAVPGVLGYYVYRFAGSGPPPNPGSPAGWETAGDSGGTTFVDSTGSAGVDYYYSIQAYGFGNATSALSPPVKVAVPY